VQYISRREENSKREAATLRENKKRIPHCYKVGDKVLYHIDSLSKYSENPYEGPYQIMHVYTNGTVQLKVGAVMDTVNIRLLKLYHD
jgi:hypothetical protein